MSSKHLFIITMEYPFGKAEAFLEDEIEELCHYYDKVFIIPYWKQTDDIRPYNEAKIQVLNEIEIDQKVLNSKLQLFLKHGKLIRALRKTERSSVTHFKTSLSHLKNVLARTESIEKFIEENKGQENHFFAMWMSAPASVLAILKINDIIDRFVSRAHGYDVEERRHHNNYIPLLRFNLKHTDHVYCNSKYTLDSLSDKVEKQKLSVSYLGLKKPEYNKSTEVTSSENLTVVSVSNLYPFKRVDKVFQVLNKVAEKKNVKWTHFGDGEQMPVLKQLIEDKNENLIIDLKGAVSRNEIFNFYSINDVDLFIHLSESEGFGYSMVEAQSFGIPVLVADTGGTKETFSVESGVLVSQDQTAKDIADIINDLVDRNLLDKMKTVSQKNFLEKFEIKQSVTALQSSITKSHA